MSVYNHIILTATYNSELYKLPINLDKEVGIASNWSYTIKNTSARTFKNLFYRFDTITQILKSRFIDRFIYGNKALMQFVELPGQMQLDEFSELHPKKYTIIKLRDENLFVIFQYLDFDSLRKVLCTCNLLYSKFFKDQEKQFWYNMYSLRFGKPPFQKSVGNWAKIYRKKLTQKK